jgi:PiT family inorganic phosphate transporter
MTLVAALLALGLAAANGSNDVSKGIATLAGAGVTGYRAAVAWGTATTLAGALASIWLGGHLLAMFSSGIVNTTPTTAFAVAVLAGAAGWVALATAARLPVSTTHAIVGALVGSGLVLDATSVRWGPLVSKVMVPLLLSAALAIAASAALGAAMQLSAPALVHHKVGAAAREQLENAPARRRAAEVPHWLSAGAVGVARGLNDTPKLTAIAACALLPAGWSVGDITALVAIAMALGALVAGTAVSRRLGEDVVALHHREGLQANLATSLLVGLGAGYGLPMSTTHVSAGAIAGVSGTQFRRLNGRTLRDFLIAWSLTPLVAGLIAAAVLAAAR